MKIFSFLSAAYSYTDFLIRDVPRVDYKVNFTKKDEYRFITFVH